MTRERIATYPRQQAASGSTSGAGARTRTWPARRKVLVAAVVAGAMVVALGVAAFAGTLSYTIQWGDTLGDLAFTHNTDVETLASLNGIENPDLIIAGEQLQIPSNSADGEAFTYVIQEGATLAGIAATFGVTVEELAALNGLENPDFIVTGDLLAVPNAGEAEAVETEVAEESTDEADESDLAGDEAGVDEAVNDTEGADDAVPVSYTAEGTQLHLVTTGETIEQIAEMYGVTAAQIAAANALEAGEVTAGMILKIPPAETEGIVLVGMPAAAEQWPLQSELAAAAVAASYWGDPVAPSDILEQIEAADNPHLGFRGNPQGMWGAIDDYGVYNEALAEALANLGFVAEPFYADGDPAMLTSRIDAGIPVVVWVTYGLAPQERIVIETETERYTLVPEQHAVVVYGYDGSGVWVVDVSDGQYKHFGWDEFLASWSLFDGMSLAIAGE